MPMTVALELCSRTVVPGSVLCASHHDVDLHVKGGVWRGWTGYSRIHVLVGDESTKESVKVLVLVVVSMVQMTG